MAWQRSHPRYEFDEGDLNQDFELFPSVSTSKDSRHGSVPSSTVPVSSIGVRSSHDLSESAIPLGKDGQAWLDWHHSSTGQDTSSLSISKAKSKLSISDSGYGSMDYTEHYHDEATANNRVPEPTLHQLPQYCEACYKDSEKRRYFTNNADRRKHMLTHTRPFKCDETGCVNHNGFASPHDLARHKKTCHSVLTMKTSKFYYRCAAPACRKKDKIWPRKDNFKAHLEGTHKYNETEVTELLLKSECTPDSLHIPTRSAKRQKAQIRKPDIKHHARKESLTDDEGSISDESSSMESGPFAGAWNSPRNLPRENSDTSTSTINSLLRLQEPTCFLSSADHPSILIPDEDELDTHEKTSRIERMDTASDFMDNIFSPYLMVSAATSSPFAVERPPTPGTSSNYSDSLFESDVDEILTDTDHELDINEEQTVFQPLLGIAVQRLLAAYFLFRQNAPGQSGGSSSLPSSFGSYNHTDDSGHDGPLLPHIGNKRRRIMDEGDDNENGQPSKRKSRVAKPDDESPLACPFNKFDPIKHEKCYTFVLKGISRVKQHLERVHSIPIHCPKCYSIFRNNPEARDKHVRKDSCQTIPERRLEGIDEATMRQIKRRGSSKSAQESWYSIFSLLFPGAPKPESPFMDTSLSAELSAFRDFCRLDGQDIVTSIANASMPSWTGHPQAQLEDFVRQVFQRTTEQLFLQWQIRPRPNTSAPVSVTQFPLPPTPQSGLVQDLNDMGMGGTFSCVDGEEPLLPISSQFSDADMQWMGRETQQQMQQQYMYFGEMDHSQQFWNDNGVLDGMGGWSG